MDLQESIKKTFKGGRFIRLLQKIMIIAIAAVLPLPAADIPVITLDEAIRSTGENNISIKSAEAILSRSLRNAGNAMGTFMPDLRLSAGMQAGGNFPPVTEAPEYTGLTLNAGASASFSFSGSMIKDGATRALAREAAILTFQNDTKSIEQSIITAYWTIAANKIQADNASTLAEDARTQYESTLEMYDCGISDELALNQAELAYNQAMLTVKTAEDTLENSKDVLRTLTGIDGDFSISPLPPIVYLSFPSAEEVFGEYSERSTAIRQSRNDLASARNTLESTRLGSYVPSITADLSYSYRGGWNASWDYGTSGHGLTGGISVSLPIGAILPGGSGDTAIRNAEDEVRIQSLALMQSQEDLMTSIRDCIVRISQYQDSMDMAEKSVSSAERTYELMNEAYEAGLVTDSELADTRTEVLTARFEALAYNINQLLESYSLAYMLDISIEDLQAEYGIKGE